jgi:hypothetical protein
MMERIVEDSNTIQAMGKKKTLVDLKDVRLSAGGLGTGLRYLNLRRTEE